MYGQCPCININLSIKQHLLTGEKNRTSVNLVKAFPDNAFSRPAEMQILYIHYYIHFSKTLCEEQEGVLLTASLLNPSKKTRWLL